jgi:hypothetical protein
MWKNIVQRHKLFHYNNILHAVISMLRHKPAFFLFYTHIHLRLQGSRDSYLPTLDRDTKLLAYFVSRLGMAETLL